MQHLPWSKVLRLRFIEERLAGANTSGICGRDAGAPWMALPITSTYNHNYSEK